MTTTCMAMSSSSPLALLHNTVMTAIAMPTCWLETLVVLRCKSSTPSTLHPTNPGSPSSSKMLGRAPPCSNDRLLAGAEAPVCGGAPATAAIWNAGGGLAAVDGASSFASASRTFKAT